MQNLHGREFEYSSDKRDKLSTTRSGAKFSRVVTPAWACSIQSVNLDMIMCQHLLQHHAQLTQLTSLTCMNWSLFTARDLTWLGAITTLRELQLGHSFTWPGYNEQANPLPLDALTRLSGLVKLRLAFGGGTHHLPPQLPALRELQLALYSCHNPWNLLNECRGLTSLLLTARPSLRWAEFGATYERQLCMAIAGMSNLQELSLCGFDKSYMGFSGGSQSQAVNLPALTSLSLMGEVGGDLSFTLRALMPACGLRVLSLLNTNEPLEMMLGARGNGCLKDLQSLTMCASRSVDTDHYGWGELPCECSNLTKLVLSGRGCHVDTASLVACTSLESLDITYNEDDPEFDVEMTSDRDPTVQIARALLHPCFSQQLTEFRYNYSGEEKLGTPDSHGMLIASLAGLQRLKVLELFYSDAPMTQFSLLMPTLASLEILQLGTIEWVPSLLSVLTRQPSLKLVSFEHIVDKEDHEMVYNDNVKFAKQIEKHCDFFYGFTPWASAELLRTNT